MRVYSYTLCKGLYRDQALFDFLKFFRSVFPGFGFAERVESFLRRFCVEMGKCIA